MTKESIAKLAEVTVGVPEQHMTFDTHPDLWFWDSYQKSYFNGSGLRPPEFYPGARIQLTTGVIAVDNEGHVYYLEKRKET